MTTIAGSLSGYLDGPASEALFHGMRQLFLDTMNNLYIPEVLNGVIRKLDSNGENCIIVDDVSPALSSAQLLYSGFNVQVWLRHW